jgi:hypothetical protein
VNYLAPGYKSPLKDWKSGVFEDFGKYLAPGFGSLSVFPIQIRIQSRINADSDLQDRLIVGGTISFICLVYSIGELVLKDSFV